MLTIARITTSGEIFWCSSNWPYVTGFSFLKTIGSKAPELLPGYELHLSHQAQSVILSKRKLYVHTFQLADSQVLILEDREDNGSAALIAAGQNGAGAGFSQGMKPGEGNLLFDLPSPGMKGVIASIAKVAATDMTVLIYGETGVGKEGIARLIHESSKRRYEPYVILNCGAIPETLIESELFGYSPGAFTGADRTGKKGVFEEAEGGTLFLDEIGELPLASQVKLLRVLQERSFKKIGQPRAIQADVRIIVATNRDLEAEVAAGRFREDLYYRLCVVPLTIPPLRERTEDIYPLLQFFLKKFTAKYGLSRTLSPRAIRSLMSYSWPGNIRQMENMMERLVVMAEEEEITLADLPVSVREQARQQELAQESVPADDQEAKPIKIHKILPLKEATAIVEKELLQMARERCGSTYEIAAMLGVDQSTISRKFKQFLE
ncbi:AAA family ATPase [Brevibacillus fluminis]|uniref:AAA family ATPase n=1 Tax=Brevibacillus fluminis TaxID=511487 RepID=A0A3M8DHR8_9BACL|nr:sigma 54-interacting transcriptional regulator [Brevibacillus fluminis]RNB86915.1 AAA family ATPase [Brevibacillus fluminis]